MARGSHWWSEPPRWAWVVIAVGTAGLIVGGLLASSRSEPSGFTAPAAAADETAEPDLTRILVIGDSYTGGSNEGGVGRNSWPSVMAEALDNDGLRATLKVDAEGGGGYVKPGQQENVFPQLVRRSVTAETDLVVFLGSRNDTAPRAVLEAAALDAFTAVQAVAPDARLLVIGPPWVDDRAPAYLQANRDALAAATSQAGGVFVDPLAEGWFTGDASALIGGDGVHPTDAGHRYMADLIGPHVKRLLASA